MLLEAKNPVVAALPAGTPPQLLVVVDTEEEFDWSKPFARENVSVDSIARQPLAHAIYRRHGVIPTYVADYPVAADDTAAAVLRALYESGECLIGAHLHPWVNPPYEEELSVAASFPGTLPRDLEKRKLAALTEALRSRYGLQPKIYKAGRYGIGAATAEILGELGYEIDVSVVPHTSYRHLGGPDFRDLPDRPYWFGAEGRLFEIPLTRGFVGALRGLGADPLYRLASGRFGMAVHAPAVLSRLGLLDRMTLTPEAHTLEEQKRLTEALIESGRTVFCLTYHSTSLQPGRTPYVRSQADLDELLARLDGYIAWFLGAIGGRATTPIALRDMAQSAKCQVAATAKSPLTGPKPLVS